MIMAMLFTCAMGLFIFAIYKKTCTSVIYSSSFGLTLVGLSLVTNLVILAVTSNVVLSLGMVGALSIVRFRSAIKEPMEIVFLFWAIAVGIVIGAGFYPLAVIGSAIIGGVIFLLANRKSFDMPYVLVLSLENGEAEKAALTYINQHTKKNVIKTKTVSKKHIEVTSEVRLLEASTGFVNDLAEMNGVMNASLVSFNGEYMV
jgi:uncharacterized membrane protein YhiD involved in acid resistance